MTRKYWSLIALVALLGGLSLYLNKDWFAKDNIQIIHLPSRSPRSTESTVAPIVFAFNHKFRLTSLEVIPVNELETKKFPRPIWHLISESNSVPIKGFYYGEHIHGMHPEVKGAQPDPLEPGVKYRLLVESGSLKGQHDFTPAAEPQ